MSLWVCNRWNQNPTDAEKYRVIQTHEDIGAYRVPGMRGLVYMIPISDYRPCEPPATPERWEDISEQCNTASVVHEDPENGRCTVMHGGCSISTENGYRLRKVQVPNHGSGMSSYFVVEKKVPA